MSALRCTSMPSKSTEGRYAWLRRCTGCLAGLLIVALGWTHGVLFVEGRSMEPTLFPGDLIVYRRVAVEPARGDIVVFDHGATLVVHRIAEAGSDGTLRTKGDANEDPDVTPLERSAVRGEIVGVVPGGRALAKLAALED